MLAPALAHVSVPELTLVTVRDASGTLTGLFPFEVRPSYRGLPIRSLRSWEHDYLFLNSPLVASGHVEATFTALLDWVASAQSPAPILDFTSIRADGPQIQVLLAEVARRRGFAVYAETRERALFALHKPVDTGISGKHKKELRRLERRLADMGKLEYRALGADEAAGPWIERFLALEASGWKGRDGTALAAQPGSRIFFVEASELAHRRGQLQMLEMTLDGVTIATKCNYTGGDGVFMFKIAYDEAYSKFSPGLLLELFNMQYLESPGHGLAWVDSCAKTEHFMAERLWSERRMLGDYSICGRGLIARTIVRHGERIRGMRRRVKAFLQGK
jgi:CelD/BcsL family acetyltransferase involved in cellulose biosynthesis